MFLPFSCCFSVFFFGCSKSVAALQDSLEKSAHSELALFALYWLVVTFPCGMVHNLEMIRLRVVCGGRRVGQVLPSYQNRQISALDETAGAPLSSLFSLLSSFSSCLLSALLISSLDLSLLFRLLLSHFLFLLSFPLSLSLFLRVMLCVILCCVVRRCVLCCVCGVVWHAENLRVCIQNVTVYAGNTRTCFSTCARGARIHGDVLNLHTEGVLYIHTGGARGHR